MSDDNTFAATCRVKSIFPDEQGEFTDLHLHNEKTDKTYKVRAWHNTIKPNVKCGETHKFTVGRVVKTRDGKTTTFFNLLNIDIPEIDVNDDLPAPTPKGNKDETITYLALAKVSAAMWERHLPLFIEQKEGDFEAGKQEWIAHFRGFISTLKEDMKK